MGLFLRKTDGWVEVSWEWKEKETYIHPFREYGHQMRRVGSKMIWEVQHSGRVDRAVIPFRAFEEVC